MLRHRVIGFRVSGQLVVQRPDGNAKGVGRLRLVAAVKAECLGDYLALNAF
jgi:hypothetical protein